MGTRTPHRTRTFRAGLAAAAAGILLAVGGVAVTPAGAAGAGQGKGPAPADGKVTICHRTNAVDNPYREIEVAFDSTNGELRGPDHTGHAGPGFDYDADPADPGYPYAPPMDGDEWGDIIPPYEWTGGSYPGSQAWLDGGDAILAADCNGGGDVDEVDLCDDGTEVGEDGTCDEDPIDLCPEPGVQPELPCAEEETDLCPEPGVQPELPCAEEETDLCPEPGVQPELPCAEVEDTDLCDEVPGEQAVLPCPEDLCPEVPEFQATDELCPPELIPPVVVDRVPPVVDKVPPQSPAPEVVPEVVPAPPKRPVQVAGIQVLPTAQVQAQTLPRTGATTDLLVVVGAGLVLVGAAAMSLGRSRQAPAGR